MKPWAIWLYTISDYNNAEFYHFWFKIVNKAKVVKMTNLDSTRSVEKPEHRKNPKRTETTTDFIFSNLDRKFLKPKKFGPFKSTSKVCSWRRPNSFVPIGLLGVVLEGLKLSGILSDKTKPWSRGSSGHLRSEKTWVQIQLVSVVFFSLSVRW